MPIEHYHPREQDLDIMAHLGEWDIHVLGRSLWNGQRSPYNDALSTSWRYWLLMPNSIARTAFAVGEYVEKGYTDGAQEWLKTLLEEVKCQK